MVEWKQEILNRAGAPKAEEGLFNKAWDMCDDVTRRRLVNQPYAIESEFRDKLVACADSAIDTSMRPPKPASAEQRGCLHAEYGHPDWMFFWDPALIKYHITHVTEPMPIAERRARCQEILDFCENYSPAAVNAVLYGYPIDELVPRELGGGVKNHRDYQECIIYVDYWFGAARPGDIAVTSFRGKYSAFSNFSGARVTLDGMSFPTVENAFQAAKTLDPTERIQFQSCPPSVAKKLGRKVTLRPDWEQVKVSVMQSLLLQKFAPGTRENFLLVSTKGLHICEGNTWHDNIWGACTCPRCANRPHKNLMGRLLMSIRDNIPYEQIQ